jgi:hypothetical protein
VFAFAKFLMGRTSDVAPKGLFMYLDDLDTLDNYAWELVTYEDIVLVLCRAASRVSGAPNSAQVHITRCSAVLQVQ